MKPSSTKKWIYRVKAIIILVLALGLLNGIIQGGHYGIGAQSFETPGENGPPLENDFDPDNPPDGPGGIAFKEMAQPTASLNLNSMVLNYEPNSEDGIRLHISINGNPVSHSLPDWMLIPTAKFVNSEFNSCVSLFGPGTTETTYDIVYHEEFQNTLLGLRLLQADVAFICLCDFWEVPIWHDAHLPPDSVETYVGYGEEIPPRANYWVPPVEEISDVFHQSLDIMGESFQSWILTDVGSDIRFDVVNNELTFTGSPYYYFWNATKFDSLATLANQALDQGDIMEYNRLVLEIQNLDMEDYKTEYLTETMKDKMEGGLLEIYNPFVYKVVFKTAHYAAFFRYVKANFPNEWNNFLGQIETVSIEPNLLTPTTWTPDCSGVCELVDSIKSFKKNPASIKVYPNPTDGPLNVNILGGMNGDLEIMIINMNGQQILRQKKSMINHVLSYQLDVSRFTPGMYVIVATDGRSIASQKFIKN